MTPTQTARKLRVLHVVHKGFGHRFSGVTHRLYSLLSGWQDEDILLDLWGTKVRPTTIGSGNLDYKLSARLWLQGRTGQGRMSRLTEYARRPVLLLARAPTFDIAHFYGLGWDALVSPFLLHLLGKKAVFSSTLHGSDDPGAVRRSRGGLLAARLLRGFDGIVAISPLLAEEYRAAGFKNVACIPNFLAIPDLEHGRNLGLREAVRSRHGISAGDRVLLFIGAAIRRKGVDLLAESFVRLAMRHPDLWLIMAGPQSPEDAPGMEQEFVNAARDKMYRSGVSSRVVWAGMLRDKEAVAGCYSAADIFVFPTRAEGLGNVVIEAAAMELPAVVTNLPGITDSVVVDGDTGLLFPREDVDALTQAVERLVIDPGLRARMGRAARAHSRHFRFESYCEQLKAFYLRVAGVRPDRSQRDFGPASTVRQPGDVS